MQACNNHRYISGPQGKRFTSISTSEDTTPNSRVYLHSNPYPTKCNETTKKCRNNKKESFYIVKNVQLLQKQQNIIASNSHPKVHKYHQNR